MSAVCDSKVDCMDGTDEQNCGELSIKQQLWIAFLKCEQLFPNFLKVSLKLVRTLPFSLLSISSINF